MRCIWPAHLSWLSFKREKTLSQCDISRTSVSGILSSCFTCRILCRQCIWKELSFFACSPSPLDSRPALKYISNHRNHPPPPIEKFLSNHQISPTPYRNNFESHVFVIPLKQILSKSVQSKFIEVKEQIINKITNYLHLFSFALRKSCSFLLLLSLF